MALLALGMTFVFIAWYALSLLVCVAGGVAVLLCVGRLQKDTAFGALFPGVARRAAGIGAASIVAGTASTLLFIILLVVTTDLPLPTLVCLWACTVLCIACGVQLLVLAGKLRQAAGTGTSYAKRRVACILCGVLALVAAAPGLLLAASLTAERFF